MNSLLQRTNTKLLIKFTSSSPPTHLHHSFRSKLHLIHPFPLEDCSVGSHCAEATLRINAQPIRRNDAETIVHRYVESNNFGTYTAYFVTLRIPGISITT